MELLIPIFFAAVFTVTATTLLIRDEMKRLERVARIWRLL